MACAARCIGRRAFSSSSVSLARARKAEDPNNPVVFTNQRPLDFDDVPTRIHAELDKDAERLHYHRLIEFELPTLKRFRSEFRPPPASHIIASRAVSYQDEPDHPRSSKATLTVLVDDLQLPAAELHALIHLAATRYDGTRRKLTISSDRFPHRAQNERYAGSMLDKLLEESKRRAGELADIPYDGRADAARLRKQKGKIVTLKDFPKDWLPDPSSSVVDSAQTTQPTFAGESVPLAAHSV